MVSIIIGVLNHLEDCTKPCLEAIMKNTSPEDLEIIIVANGCTDGTEEYIRNLQTLFNIKLLSFKDALGYAKANNEGIKIATGEYIVLLNNDAFLIEQPKNTWLNMLKKPFLFNEKVGITAPLIGHSDPANRDFAVFFCVMIKREVFDKIGLLDEVFGVGGGEDTDFCIKAVDIGYTMVQVPEVQTFHNGTMVAGGFPIYHKGEATVFDNPEWNNIFKHNSHILAERYNHQWKLGNNCERAVISKVDNINRFPREKTRYEWAAKNLTGKDILEIGCSSGYGTKLLPNDIEYIGLDYSDEVIQYARREFGDENHLFVHADINKVNFIKHDTIIAFEVLEHLDNGLQWAQELKKYCDTLLITVPFKEVKGLWGVHHKLHDLDITDFPDFEYSFISEDGRIIDKPERFDGMNLLLMKWQRGHTSYKVDSSYVVCSVATKDRYDILPSCLQSIAMQTRTPNHLIIYDDGEHQDLRNVPAYRGVFNLLYAKKISWEVVFGNGKGQHYGHQYVNSRNTNRDEIIWRIDDDEIAEPNVLENLLSHMKDNVGAVGGMVIDPTQGFTKHVFKHQYNAMQDINFTPNVQWEEKFMKTGQAFEVEHLYSSFIYKAHVADYCLDLSPVAHREETIFTHELKRAGYEILFTQDALTWHLRAENGGIRSHDNKWFYEHDEKIFKHKMEQWGYKFITLNCGLGDHLAFLHILPELLERYSHITIGCCYPEVFQDFKNYVNILGVAQTQNIADDNIYKWMIDHNWKQSLVKAFYQMYLGDK